MLGLPRGKQNAHLLNLIPDDDLLEALEQSDYFKVREICGKVKTKEGKPSIYDYRKYKWLCLAPFMISNKCCDVMKKTPIHEYEKKTGRKGITAQMASESKLRTTTWLLHGCNAFDAKRPISNPMAFWTEQDVLLYIYQNNIPICSVYGDVVKDTEIDGQLDFENLGIFDLGVPTLKTTGCKRTGCMLCGFGAHLETGEGRFQMLKKTHPKMYELLDVVKNNGVTFREAIEWTNEHGNLNIKL